MANSVDPDQTIGAVCSESTLFASILDSSVMLGNYLPQTTSEDQIKPERHNSARPRAVQPPITSFSDAFFGALRVKNVTIYVNN